MAADAHKYGLELELGLKANVKNVNKARDAVKRVVEELDKIDMEDKLAKQMRVAEDSFKHASKGAYRLNKVLEVSAKLAKRFGDAADFDEIVEKMGERAKLTKEEIEDYKKLAHLNKEREEHTDLAREQQREISRAARLAARDAELEEMGRQRRLEGIKSIMLSTTGTMAKLVGLSDVWSDTLSSTKTIAGGIDRFFFAGMRKRLQDKIIKLKREEILEKAHAEKTALYQKNVIKDVEDIKDKASKKRIKKSKEEANAAKAAAGGGGGAGGGRSLSAAGGGGASIKATQTALAALNTTMRGLTAAIGIVTAVFSVLKRALTLSSDVLEEFHTATYHATGGAESLGLVISDLAIDHDFLIDEIKDATKSMVHMGLALSENNTNFERNVVNMAAFTRVTGVATDVTAKFVKVQEAQGAAWSNNMISLGKVIETMQNYALTTDEASEIITYATKESFRMNVVFGEMTEGGNKLVSVLANISAATKRMGMDISIGIGLFDKLNQDMTKFIVATQGFSLQGPIAGMEAMVMNIDEIVKSLPDDPFVKDIILKNVYGISPEEVKLLERMNTDYNEWKQEQIKFAQANNQFINEAEISYAKWNEAGKEAEQIAGSIEKMANDSNNNIARTMELMRDKVLAAFMKIGVTLMPAFVEAGKVLLNVVSELINFVFGEQVDFSAAFRSMDEASVTAKAIAEEQKALEQLQKDRAENAEKINQLEQDVLSGKLKGSSEEAKLRANELGAAEKDLAAREKEIKAKNYTAEAEKELAKANKDGVKRLQAGGWLQDLKDVLMLIVGALKGIADFIGATKEVADNFKTNTKDLDTAWNQVTDHWKQVFDGERTIFGGIPEEKRKKMTEEALATPPEVAAEIEKALQERATKEATPEQSPANPQPMTDEGAREAGRVLAQETEDNNINIYNANEELVGEMRQIRVATEEQTNATHRMERAARKKSAESSAAALIQGW